MSVAGRNWLDDKILKGPDVNDGSARQAWIKIVVEEFMAKLRHQEGVGIIGEDGRMTAKVSISSCCRKNVTIYQADLC